LLGEGTAAGPVRGSLSLPEARRLAVSAHGLSNPRRTGGPANSPRLDAVSGSRHARPVVPRQKLRTTTRDLGLLQIDSVNVLVRAHFMPLFSRLGAYDQGHLAEDAYCTPAKKRLFEYWAHEACLIPIEMQPLFRWRMAEAERGVGIYKGLVRFADANKSLIADVLAAVRTRGPMQASDIEIGAKKGPGWWSWSDAKCAIEWLFWSGKVTTLRRETAGFARIYDIPERALPADVLALPTPSPQEAQRALILHAAKALGVATETDLREYFRLPIAEARARLAELEEAGDIARVSVEGWDKPGFMLPGAKIPRAVSAAAFLSPFDPLISERGRAERLFDFHYRIEIYTPAPKRQYGYYCLPLLLDDRIVGRFDLKADRAEGVLRVEAAHVEGHADVGAVADAARGELSRMAGWLGLERVDVKGRGGLAGALR
jgi:uncharacterized protein